MRERSRFFLIDSKSFELRVVWVKGRGEVQIVVKGKGYQRWIKANRGVVEWLLKGLDSCCKWRGEKLLKGELKDCGRIFRLEIRQNEVGRYLMVFVLSEDDRRYFIIISEGYDLLGWDIMGRKLRELLLSLGVIKGGEKGCSTSGRMQSLSLVKLGLSYVDVTKNVTGRRGEEVWVEIRKEEYSSKLKDFSRCLVGKWDIEGLAPDIRVEEKWANTHWRTFGLVKVAVMRDSLFLFEFSTQGRLKRL